MKMSFTTEPLRTRVPAFGSVLPLKTIGQSTPFGSGSTSTKVTRQGSMPHSLLKAPSAASRASALEKPWVSTIAGMSKGAPSQPPPSFAVVVGLLAVVVDRAGVVVDGLGPAVVVGPMPVVGVEAAVEVVPTEVAVTEVSVVGGGWATSAPPHAATRTPSSRTMFDERRRRGRRHTSVGRDILGLST